MTAATFPRLAFDIGIVPLTSAETALVRLHGVIAADRAAVPCGRWVRTGFYLGRMPTGRLSEHLLFVRRLRKPVYRWSVRR